MDQEPQPSVWPPAPQGMERTPPTNVTTFKPAPTGWAIGLLALATLSEFVRSLCGLGVMVAPKMAMFGAVNTSESRLSSDIITIALVAFLVWFYRVYKNLAAFETAGLRDTAGWAVGWFFVPVMSFYRPYQMAQIIWQASSPKVDSRNENAWRREPVGRAVIAWWGLTLLTEIISIAVVVGTFAWRSATAYFSLASAGIALASAATNMSMIVVIRAISARQQAKEVHRFWSARE